MSDYPSAKDSFNVIGTANFMDEAGYVLHNRLNIHGSAVVAIEDVLGTTAGTSVLKDFTAGDFAPRVNASNVFQHTVQGTINNSTLGTPAITGGTVNSATVGTPDITGGTTTNMAMEGRTSFVARRGAPLSLDNMGASKTVYFSQGESQHGTLDNTGTCTITFGSTVVGDFLTLTLTQGTAGGGTIKFGGTVHAAGSTSLGIGTAANAVNVLGFRVHPTNADIIQWVASQQNMGTF